MAGGSVRRSSALGCRATSGLSNQINQTQEYILPGIPPLGARANGIGYKRHEAEPEEYVSSLSGACSTRDVLERRACVERLVLHSSKSSPARLIELSRFKQS